MLDVHPPHAPTHTWRDFLIHIATIVVGLLIAVGLEQSVEYIHHRREIAVTREDLRKERVVNAQLSAVAVKEFRRIGAALQIDLNIFLYLEQHPGAPPATWPGKLSWTFLTIAPINSAWQTAQRTSVLTLMPPDEVRDDTELYRRLQALTDAQVAFANANVLARSFSIRQPDPTLFTPAQIEKELDLISSAIFLHAQAGTVEANVARHFPDFSAATSQELDAALHTITNPADTASIRALAAEVQKIKIDSGNTTHIDTYVQPNPKQP
jgi:hypothetical protein